MGPSVKANIERKFPSPLEALLLPNPSQLHALYPHYLGVIARVDFNCSSGLKELRLDERDYETELAFL